VFIAGALAMLPALAASTSGVGSIDSVGSLWRLGERANLDGARGRPNRRLGFLARRVVCLDMQPGDARRTVGHGHSALCAPR